MNTPSETARDQIAAAVAEVVDRAVIDQAKGMLILLYGVDDQAAFDKLGAIPELERQPAALAEQLVFDYRHNGDFSRTARSTGKR